MFAWPLFHDVREQKKTATLKGANINTTPTSIGTVRYVGMVWFEIAK